jgi:hypothetical protein
MLQTLWLEILIILLAVLASNGLIYILWKMGLKKTNSTPNISLSTNSSEKEGLAITSLIASSPLRITHPDGGSSNDWRPIPEDDDDNYSNFSEDTLVSDNVSVSSSDTLVSPELSPVVSPEPFDIEGWIASELSEGMMTYNPDATIATNDANVDMWDVYTSLDSITILNGSTYAQWRDIAMELQEHPVNTPAGILQQIKLEELNILYSQDIIHFGISQTELRLIIEHLPSISLFNPEINHFILTIMSYYHT